MAPERDRRRTPVPPPEPFEVAGERVDPGTRRRIDLPVARLPTGTWASLPLAVLHGVRPGPVLWVDAAIHGDEVVGVEVLRRVLQTVKPRRLAGTLLAVPVVNVFGFLGQSRTLPDRRDLNRCFPGSPRGSLASRLAWLFREQVVRRSDFGIDLHSGSHRRRNLPQVRGDLGQPEVLRLARAFGAPVVLHSKVRSGSLREAATALGVPMVVYEGGEALRLGTPAVEAGTRGVLRVMAALGMGDLAPRARPAPSLVARRSRWVRARRGGVCRLTVTLGRSVAAGDRVAVIADPFGEEALAVTTPVAGVVVGVATNPLVHRGDAVVHVAETLEEEAGAQ